MICVPYRTSNGSSWVPLDSHLFPEGMLFINGAITSELACEFVQKLMYLREEKPNSKLRVYICSPGGECDAGLMILDILKGLDIEFDLFCIGIAASMAAVLVAGGQKGRRFILPHSRVMIHEPLIDGVGGSATSVQRTAETIMETKRITVELLAEYTGKNVKEIEKAISFDNYMNAQEAVRFGICDKVVTKLF